AHQRRVAASLLEAERNHVRVAVTLEVSAIQRANRACRHERHRHERVLHALSAENPLSDLADALTAQGNANAFKGDAHENAQVLASSWSYARMMSRTKRCRTTSASVK